jgi:hypothetical protein
MLHMIQCDIAHDSVESPDNGRHNAQLLFRTSKRGIISEGSFVKYVVEMSTETKAVDGIMPQEIAASSQVK